jgi:hypothetical protein
MKNLSKRQQIFLFVIFSLIMMFTRGNHFPTLAELPDASWAIFFLIGFYFSNLIFLTLAIAQFVLIDYFVVTKLGVGDYCYTSAYFFLPLAYSTLWVAGKWLSKHWEPNFRGMINFFIAGFLGILACEIISSGSFNLINQTQANGFDLIELLVKYFPNALKITFGYLFIVIAIQVIIDGIKLKTTAPKTLNFHK